MKNLCRRVGVEGGDNRRDLPHVFVNKLAKSLVIFHRPLSGAPPHKQLKVGQAEGCFAHQSATGNAPSITMGRRDLILGSPGSGLAGAFLIGHPVDFTDKGWVKKAWGGSHGILSMRERAIAHTITFALRLYVGLKPRHWFEQILKSRTKPEIF
jgi:hypothetical protein